MQTTSCGCTNNVTMNAYQPVSTNQQADRSNGQRNTNFNNNSLTGDEASDSVLLGLILVLVQLLMQQFNGGNGNSGGNGQNNPQAQENGGDFQFNPNEQRLLVTAIGRDPAVTQLQSANDTDASGNLNQGDNLGLLTGAQQENHVITDDQVLQFIETRNPAGTPKLPLTADQSNQLQLRYDLTDISVSDINGDGQISLGDYISGTREAGGNKQRVDIPVDQQTMALFG